MWAVDIHVVAVVLVVDGAEMGTYIVGGRKAPEGGIELVRASLADATALCLVPMEEKRLVVTTLVHFATRALMAANDNLLYCYELSYHACALATRKIISIHSPQKMRKHQKSRIAIFVRGG